MKNKFWIIYIQGLKEAFYGTREEAIDYYNERCDYERKIGTMRMATNCYKDQELIEIFIKENATREDNTWLLK